MFPDGIAGGVLPTGLDARWARCFDGKKIIFRQMDNKTQATRIRVLTSTTVLEGQGYPVRSITRARR